ncbi:MAG: AsmA-like C-terminal region-containing protein [Bacteroidota bacterium]
MKIKKFLKRSFFFLLAIVLLVIGAAFAIPYFFKDEVVTLVKKEINNSVDAKIDFNEDIKLSLLRSFPDLSLTLSDLSVSGNGIFEGLDLAVVKNANLQLDLMSVVNKENPIIVKDVKLEGADIYIKVNENRTANYDIAKSSGSASEPVDFEIKLESYSVVNSNFIYDDAYTNTYIEVKNFEHTGKGDLTSAIFDLSTSTQAESLSLFSGGIPLINKAKTDADITIEIDNNDFRYTLKDNDIILNALKLDVDGWVEAPDENVELDLDFSAPSTDFKHLLSMIPAAYTPDFQDVEANGEMALDGHIKGIYNQNSLPAFSLKLDVDNGSFQYPGLPAGAENIEAKVNVSSPSSNLDEMVVDIPTLSMDLGNNPFEAILNLKKPISDPEIKGTVKGIIDLGELSEVFPVEGVDRMNGTVDADLAIDTKMSYVEREEYEKVNMSGDLKLSDLTYHATGQPMIKIWSLDLNFSPQHVELVGFDGQLGKSDVKASGKLDNILAYFSPNLTMEGNLLVRSKLFDANEWIEQPAATRASTTFESEESYGSSEVFNRFSFGLDARIDKLIYDELEFENAVAKGNFTPETINLQQFSAKTGNSDIRAEGQLVNVFDYLFEDETLGGNLELKSRNLDLNELYNVEAPSPSPDEEELKASTEVSYPVPERVDVKVDASIDKLTYADMVFRDMDGKIEVKNQRASVNSFSAKGMGGEFDLKGFYDTSDPSEPRFDLNYKLKNLDVSQAFEQLNSMKILAPVTQFIEGALSSELSLSGKLKPNLSLDYTSLSGSGLFETFNAVLTNCTPLARLGDQLDIPELKKVSIEDTKNWFNLKDGMFVLEPADMKLNGLNVNVSGSHGILNQSMDYSLKFDVPKEVLNKGAVGSAASKGLDFFGEQAGRLGIDLAQGDNVKFNVRYTGSLTDPKLKLDLIGTDKESVKEEILDAVTETVKDEVEDRLLDEIGDRTGMEAGSVNEVVDEVKEKAEDKAQEFLDETIETAKETAIETAKETVGDTAKAVVNDILGKQAEELLGKDSTGTFNNIKDKIKFPFGKKNKDKGGN